MIYIKSERDILLIRQAVSIWKEVKIELTKACKPGVSLLALDKIAAEIIEKNDATCSFYQYEGFPGHICISVNAELIHGIPSNYILKKEDMVTFDVGVTYKNHVCDSAFTIIMDEDNVEAKKISEVTYDSLIKSISVIKPGATTGDIGYEIEKIANEGGYEVIKDFGGHGCGNKVHEDPMILCYGSKGKGTKLEKNMVICIEPMLMTDSDEYIIDKKNKWTVISKNKKLTCHWEHMVLVTENGYEILTQDNCDKI